MKQLSKKALALLLVIYIIVLGSRVYTKVTDESLTSYMEYNPVDNVTINFYLNSAPTQVEDLPDLEWNEGYTYTGLDLDDYFNDTPGEILSYTFTGPNNIAIAIGNDSVITAIPVSSSWTGTDYVIFTAWDNYGLSTAGNNATLTVVPYDAPTTSSSSGSGGGGGGGGGTKYEKAVCVENWACTDWTRCISGKQTRTCLDVHNCDVNDTMPSISQTCTVSAVEESFEIEDLPFEPIIREVSHRPVLWVVLVLVAVFSFELYIYLKQRKKRSALQGNYYG
ncbi:hypothetical protein HOD83_00110 [Candidatus Woesearchaeota archaeon]|nr:hypothetical protein [Candidatus Woesearchaeota archaeon]MBT4247983.1 hypothetical protein [Candidatus Woesearchaeota archaeon]